MHQYEFYRDNTMLYAIFAKKDRHQTAHDDSLKNLINNALLSVEYES